MTPVPFSSDSEIAAAIPGALAHLRAGRVLAHPTETIYGLGSTLNSHAVARVAAMKGREPQKPFVVLIAGHDMLDALEIHLTPLTSRLTAEFWPGPLTLVLPTTNAALPPEVRGPGGVGVRWTSHMGMQRVIRALGAPITSTSANRSGLPPFVSGEEIARGWRADVASGNTMVLDAGAFRTGTPSTVVDCSGPALRILRHGSISLEQLRQAVPDLVGES